jgi:hypothetical protein
MHFDLLQGYLTGKPEFPAVDWAYTPNYVAVSIR